MSAMYRTKQIVRVNQRLAHVSDIRVQCIARQEKRVSAKQAHGRLSDFLSAKLHIIF